jgi:hypothetical protein
MRYLVIERFPHGPEPIYARAATQGRPLAPGLSYLDSWVAEQGLDRCFQLMETAQRPALMPDLPGPLAQVCADRFQGQHRHRVAPTDQNGLTWSRVAQPQDASARARKSVRQLL